MDRGKLIKILLITFAILTAASAISLFYAYQKPTYERQTIILGTYTHRAIYDYVAELKPNIIYNKTTLKPGEGTLYTAITTGINITFTYKFISSPSPETIGIALEEITAEIESPGKWTKPLHEDEVKELMNLEGSMNFTLKINCTAIRQLIDRIDKEIGTYSSSFNIRVKPRIRVDTIVAKRTVNETYTPELIVMFRAGTEKGNYISIEGLNQTKNKDITETREITYPEVEARRNMFSATTLTTAIGLAALIIAHLKIVGQQKSTERKSKELLKRIMEEYKDAIAEAVGSPPKTQTTIDVESLEDLTKIAQILAKPILRAKEDEEQIFYIIDGNMKYQYKIKA
ncbi:MAG: DUF5305 family protein [Candidatus Bathyarchaeia archaeon]